MKNKGFTLMEFIVLMAIIGILSSIVLTSINSTREKSNKDLSPREICEKYKNYPMDKLPAKCFGYFKTKIIN